VKSLNKVMIIGLVDRVPEMRYTPGGQAVTSFSVTTRHSWTNSEGERCEAVEGFSVVAWDDLAELCKQLLCKGQQVYVEGRLQTRHWEGPQGEKRYRTELVAREMIALDEH